MTEGRADLHIHTNGSDGELKVEQVIDQALILGLTAIAITDHDNVAPSLRAKEIAAKRRLDLEIITGAEITLNGFRHLLALNIEEDLPFGLPLLEAISLIHDQKGLAVAAHPLVGLWPASLKQKEIYSVIDSKERDIYLDGFEILNGSVKNDMAKLFYYEFLSGFVAEIAGSDTHFRRIGKAVTVYDLEKGLIPEIKERRTTVRDCFRDEGLTPQDYLRNLYRSLIKEPIRRGRII